jgi:SAM-dependent methyltransferase
MSQRLHLGCGIHYLDGWYNVDGRAAPVSTPTVVNGIVVPGVVGRTDGVLDLQGGLWQLVTAAYEWVYWCHGPEHAAPDRLPEVLRHLYRALMPGGKLTIATTDFEGIYLHRFLEQDDGCDYKAALFADTTSTAHPFDMHRNVFTFEELCELLAAAGFARVRRWRPEEYPEIAVLGDYSTTAKLVSVYAEGLKA